MIYSVGIENLPVEEFSNQGFLVERSFLRLKLNDIFVRAECSSSYILKRSPEECGNCYVFPDITAVLILLKTACVGTHTDSRVDLVFSRKTWSVGTHTILP